MKKQFEGNDICTVVRETYANKDHMYLGYPELAQVLTEKFKITEFYERKKNTIATVGFAPKAKGGRNWFGWSHRAISSFKTRKEAERFAKEVA